MGRIILVSNRLPVTVLVGSDDLRVEPSVGGLATALRDTHQSSGGLWVGWPGPTDGLDRKALAALDARFAERGTVPVHLTAHEVHRFYEVFANGLIWPLFHYVTGNLPLRVEGWEDYQVVNARFASVVSERYRPGDTIWIHDYQLMLVPGMVRERLPHARIGFFLHTPFPSAELFAVLPYREAILRGMLGADLIGFHTSWYRQYFVDSLARVLDIAENDDHVDINGRSVQLGVFPIGVDAHTYQENAKAAAVAEEVARLRGDGTCKLMVGIDRLDYTKGIPRRLLAFEQLLIDRPNWRGRVRLVQVAVPSRTGVSAYRRFRHEVDALVGHINGVYGTPHWTPVHYLYRSVPESQLLALYRAADVMLVTPVRDGMNLVSKEFVATRFDEQGVLVLSEFAGAAAQMDGAVLVNPFDVETAAQRYYEALTMPSAECAARMRRLRAHVFDYDVHRWTREFLGELVPDTPPAEPRKHRISMKAPV
jgi:trehalose 6-phosphate synthase/phosphatase